MNKRVISFVISLAIIALPVVAWMQRDALFDTWRLHNYQAPAEIVRLADVTTMTQDSRRLFYVYQPALFDKAAFNGVCTDSEQTIVLGCYIEHRGIYLYNVSEPRLNGVIEVTAAHEMLHAAYDRLSTKERERIDALLAQAANGITDERLKQTIENYRKKDPTVVPNELHSILGTEVRILPAELETYYKRYFTNRGAIVDFSDGYKQAFTEREQQVQAFDARLSALKSEIDALNASLESQQASLKTQFNTLQQQKSSGDIDNYNRGVPLYNQAVNQYNGSVNRQRSLVNEYNDLVEQRNALATEENQLIKALDSRSPIETQ